MTIVKVEGRPDLVKDMTSGAVLSVNKKARDEYFRQKSIINSNNKMMEDVSSLKEKIGDIDSIKEDINEIKSLIQKIIDNKGL